MNKTEYEFAPELCESSWFKAFSKIDGFELFFTSFALVIVFIVAASILILTGVMQMDLALKIGVSIPVVFCVAFYVNAYYRQIREDYARIKKEISK